MYVEGVMSCNKSGSLCEPLSSGTKQRSELRQKKIKANILKYTVLKYNSHSELLKQVLLKVANNLFFTSLFLIVTGHYTSVKSMDFHLMTYLYV